MPHRLTGHVWILHKEIRHTSDVAKGKPRGKENAYDMVLSMGAVLIAVAVILVITHRSHKQTLPPVDYSGAVTLAQSQDKFVVDSPSSVPAGYVMTNARFEPESYGATGDMRWYLGYRTLQNTYISLWQSDGPSSRVINGATAGATCDGEVTIKGEVWRSCANPRTFNQGVVQVANGVTTIVWLSLIHI